MKILLFFPFLLPIALLIFTIYMIMRSTSFIDKVLSFLAFGLSGVVFFWLIIGTYYFFNILLFSKLILTIATIITVILLLLYIVLLFVFRKLSKIA